MAIKGITKKKLKEILSKTFGNVLLTAKTFSVTRATIYKYVKKYELNDFRGECENSLLEVAENTVAKKIMSGDPKDNNVLIFYLKTRGKGKYQEKQIIETTNKDERPFILIAPPEDDDEKNSEE